MSKKGTSSTAAGGPPSPLNAGKAKRGYAIMMRYTENGKDGVRTAYFMKIEGAVRKAFRIEKSDIRKIVNEYVNDIPVYSSRLSEAMIFETLFEAERYIEEHGRIATNNHKIIEVEKVGNIWKEVKDEKIQNAGGG